MVALTVELMVVMLALVMAGVDFYPSAAPEMPRLPSLELDLEQQFVRLGIALVGSVVVAALLARLLPRVPLFNAMVSAGASGVQTVAEIERKNSAEVGQEGTAISPLRPGGKAQFGDTLLDVITQGEGVEKGARVRIIGHSGSAPVVEGI